MARGRRTGVFIVRAWMDDELEPPVRLRVTQTADLLAGSEETWTVLAPEEACNSLKAWFAELSARP